MEGLLTIENIINYVPILLFTLVFVYGFIVGTIKGRYKTIRKFSYVLILMVVLLIFTPLIVKGLLGVDLPVLGTSINNMIDEMINDNEAIAEILTEIPELAALIPSLIVAVVSPIMYVLFVWIGQYLLFPLHIVYKIFYNKIFIKKDEDSFDINANKKGNKKKKKKYRLQGGLIRGVQAVFVFSLIMMPVNAVNRLYNTTKNTLAEEGKSLCSSLEFLEDMEDVCTYLDTYNATLFAKGQKANIADMLMFRTLSSFKVGKKRTNIEKELTIFIDVVDKIDKANLLTLLEGDVDKDIINQIEYDKIDDIIDALFKSQIFSNLVVAGVNYGIKLAAPELKDLLEIEDEEFELDLKYSEETFKQEIKTAVSIFKIVKNHNLVSVLDDDLDDPLTIRDSVSEEVLYELVDALFAFTLVRAILPDVAYHYGHEYGVNKPEQVDWDLETSIIKDALSLIYLIDNIDDMDLILDNLTTVKISKVGAFLDNLNTSDLFGNVLSIAIPKLVNDLNDQISLTSEMINNVTSWEDELLIVKDVFDVYKQYEEDGSSDFPFAEIKTVLLSVKSSDLIMGLMPEIMELALPLVSEDIVVPANVNWHTEIDYMVAIVDALIVIDDINDLSIELLSNVAKRDALADIIDAATSSAVFGDYVKNLLLDLLAPVFDVVSIELSIDDINAVNNWRLELTNVVSLYDDFFEDDSIGINDFNSETVNNLFATLESIQLLTNHRTTLLLSLVEMTSILDETQFNAIDREAVDYETEKNIIILLISSALSDDMSSFDLSTGDMDDLGELLNAIYDENSVIFKDFVTDQLLSLGDLGDSGITQAKIESINDWVLELNYIQTVIQNIDNQDFSNFNLDTASEAEIENLALVITAGLGSEILHDQFYDTLETLFTGFDLDVDIYAVTDWEYELTFVQSILQADDSSDLATIQAIFDELPNSQLLGGSKDQILIRVAKEFDNTITVTSLTPQEYDAEVQVLYTLIENKDTIDNLGTTSFGDLDSQSAGELGAIIDDTIDSILFGNKVRDGLEDMLDGNGHPGYDIDDVESWEDTLPILVNL